jgi:hypothetical protein
MSERQQEAQQPIRRTSDMLRDIALSQRNDTISIGEFVSLLGDRSFALVILLFALPNAIPVPGIPGFSTLTGVPIMLIALQIALGRDTIWLPEKIRRKQFSQAFLRKIVDKSLPVLLWIEKWLHPRLVFLCEGWSERLIGLLVVVLAGILALPIPGGNFLPGASILLLSLALLEKDGWLASAGVIFSVCSIVFMYKVIVFVISSVAGWIMGVWEGKL